MGSGGEDYPKRQQPHTKSKLKMILLVIFTNLLTIYIFTGPSFNTKLCNTAAPLPLWSSSAALLQDLNSTRAQLEVSNFLIAELQEKLKLLIELTSTEKSQHLSLSFGAKFSNGVPVSDELMLAIGPQKLPLGFSPRMGSDQIYPPVGSACLKYHDELSQYMKYEVGGECPSDDVFAQRLMLKGCEPLPRRRCHPRRLTGYVEPAPFPKSLWETPPDSSVFWDAYTCKNYKCLIDRRKSPGYFDCKDCFELQGREKSRLMFDNGGLDFGIDQVLKTKPPGTIRIGFDMGGGTGTFAARMREINITIITSTMNLDGPFNSFIASRGLIPIHVSVSHRLPFFENTLDIVHSMHILSNWIPDTMLEFALYDIFRVLRPGGLFWLDHFFCLGSQLNHTYIPMLDRVGFKRLRWHAGIKFDRGVHKNEWYFSALLEKPMT